MEFILSFGGLLQPDSFQSKFFSTLKKLPNGMFVPLVEPERLFGKSPIHESQ